MLWAVLDHGAARIGYQWCDWYCLPRLNGAKDYVAWTCAVRGWAWYEDVWKYADFTRETAVALELSSFPSKPQRGQNLDECKFAVEEWEADLAMHEHRQWQKKKDKKKLSILYTVVTGNMSFELRACFDQPDDNGA